tara:strand:- start:21068 stop:21529 length:462 start_codon:yes stop_codon:yes gene_type:complete
MGDHNSDTEDEEDDTTTNFVNDITLNFLMNKNHHKKYISKTNPEEHQREQKHQSSLRKYKNKIIDLTQELINSPDKQITTDVNEIFIGYTKTLIRYFKMKEIENNDFHNNSDEDVLFGTMNETDDEIDENKKEKETKNPDMISFWGTTISKTK